MFAFSQGRQIDQSSLYPGTIASQPVHSTTLGHLRQPLISARRTRRDLLLAAGLALAAGAVGRPDTGGAQDQMPAILPRASWGAVLPPVGPVEVEAPGDVRFLLVHHTASGNDYGQDDVAGLLQSFHRAHTSPEKGWPDIAYNFMVDRFGRTWEGRAGSIAGPVKGSATGGSQGFAQLCCFIGNHELAPPTPDAQAAMVALLGWLADRYGINVAGQTSFTSRGSNRFPAGTPVTTSTIAGHRDMSQTVCPGVFGYDLVGRLPGLVQAATAVPVPVVVPSPSESVAIVEDGPERPSAPVESAPEAFQNVPLPSRPPVSIVSTKGASAAADLVGLRTTAATLVTAIGAATAVVIRRRGLR